MLWADIEQATTTSITTKRSVRLRNLRFTHHAHAAAAHGVNRTGDEKTTPQQQSCWAW